MFYSLIEKLYNQSDEAAKDIEKFVEKQTKEDLVREEKAKMTAGCKTVENKTVINNKMNKEDIRKQKSEEIKLMGNNAFKSGNFKQAEEYYTSALLEYDQVVILCNTSIYK